MRDFRQRENPVPLRDLDLDVTIITSITLNEELLTMLTKLSRLEFRDSVVL